MTSQIPKVSGIVKNYNFKISAFCDIIHPLNDICTCLRCNKLCETAFYSLSIKTFAYHL